MAPPPPSPPSAVQEIPHEIWQDVLSYAVGPLSPPLPPGASRAEKRDANRARLNVVLVSRTFKRASLKFLYYDPILIDSSSFVRFCQALQHGERHWDHLRKDPRSQPGSWVRLLDLCSTSLLPYDPCSSSSWIHQPFHLNSLLSSILPLLPNVGALRLPTAWSTGGLSFVRSLTSADWSGQLKELEELGVLMNGARTKSGKDPLVELLEEMPKLEALGVRGEGRDGLPPSTDDESGASQRPSLDLPRLKKLTIRGVDSGLLLEALVTCPLPSLTSLEITPYYTSENDLTYRLLQAHGERLRHLTYAAPTEFPRPLHLPLPIDTLSLCPNLDSLQILLSTNHTPPPPNFFHALPIDPDTPIEPHPLRSLTLSRPPSNIASYDAIIRTLLNTSRFPHLQSVNLTQFTWIAASSASPSNHNNPIQNRLQSFSSSPPHSYAAMSSGVVGSARQWALMLGRRGVALMDGKGRTCPGIVRGEDGKWGEAGLPGLGVKGRSKEMRRRRPSVLNWEDESDGGG